MPRVLAIGDAHFPWVHRKTQAWIYSLVRQLCPEVIVQMGDLFDFYSFSRFPRTHDLITPEKEVKLGRRMALEFWRDIQAAASKARCFQLRGNHDERPKKRILEKAPEFASLVSGGLRDLWLFDGVETLPDDRHELVLNGVVFMHGHRKHGEHVRHNHMSTVVGHLHTGGTVFVPIRGKTLWELNAGYVADPSSLPMSYTAQMRFRKETPGVGWIDEYGPRFIPMERK